MADHAHSLPGPVDDYAGMRRDLEIGVRLAPTRATAPAAAKALGAFLDSEPDVPVRLAGLAADDSRVLITVAITLGSIDDIKVATPSTRTALTLIQRIVDELAVFDPAFATLPQPRSAEARLAAHVMRHPDELSTVVAVRHLAAAH